MTPTTDQEQLVQQAARALGNAGLVHAYGHCSLRLDDNHFLVCAAMPMGLIGDEPGTVVAIDAPLADNVLGEVRIHQCLYRRRPDINAVCRIMPPMIMALSTQGIVPRPRHGIGAYFSPPPILWDDPRLLRDDVAANRLAAMMGDAPAIIMRGNGAVVVADGLEKAVTLAWFLEDSARMESAIRTMGLSPEDGLLDNDEVAARQVFAGGVVERMWAWLQR